MPADRFRANYDELAQIAKSFGSEADAVVAMLETLSKNLEVLKNGAWVGVAADAFYQEMDSILLPSIRRLWHALSEGKVQTLQVRMMIQEAEREAARFLNGSKVADLTGGVGGVGSGVSAGSGTSTGGPASPPVGYPAVAGFERVANGVQPIADAPAFMSWPATLADGMNDAWRKSFPDGVAQEQGGILVRTAKGEYEFRPGPPGDSGSFFPNYSDLKPGETLIADAHTHPYDATEGGKTNVSFSPQDAARLALGAEVNNVGMSMMQSGEGRFALVRTKEFDELVAKDGADVVFESIKADGNAVLKATPGTMEERAMAAMLAVAKKYNLAFYHGTDATLTRINP
jgi:WXG100 family type VII secretion target